MSTHLSSPIINQIDFLSIERTLNAVPATSKKKVIESAAKILSVNISHLNEGALFESLVQREKIGATAIGHGCAIPHCRADGIDKAYACFMKLEHPVDFDAADKEPVDLVFAIVVPTEATELHLNILSEIAEFFHHDEMRKKLRDASSKEALFKLLTDNF